MREAVCIYDSTFFSYPYLVIYGLLYVSKKYRSVRYGCCFNILKLYLREIIRNHVSDSFHLKLTFNWMKKNVFLVFKH